MPHVSLSPAIHCNGLIARSRQALAMIANAAAFALAAAVLTPVAPAHAVIGTIDNTPAATLLLPYFEVDLGNPNGTQTSFTLMNIGRAQTLAHVTLWTDYAVPTYSFDLYLGGRDTIEVDLRLLFTSGILPQASSTLSTAGPASDAHTPIPSCVGFSPAQDQLAAAITGHLRAAHTGAPSSQWGGMCGGAVVGDNIARGYVTIDQVNQCSQLFPSDPGYFVAGGLGVAGNNNVLAGQYTQLDRSLKLSITESLVAIEASSTSPVTTTYNVPNGMNPPTLMTAYTFYGRFTTAAADQREPVGSQFGSRYSNGSGFAGSVTVWRDFDRPAGQVATPFACNAPPTPMGNVGTAMFDEQERAYYPGGSSGIPYSRPLPGFDPKVFPRATQRVSIFALNAQPFGWMYVDLDASGDTVTPAFNSGARQAHVSVQRVMNGQYGGSVNAHQIYNVSDRALNGNNSTPIQSIFQ